MKGEMILAKRLSCVPGGVYAQGKWRFHPVDFETESEYLQSRVISAEKQLDSLANFKATPCDNVIYVVSANPDDMKAKYFAAYLATIHQAHLKHNANIRWESVYGGYTNKLLTSEEQFSMLILSGLAINSTPAKIEKARDLIERFSTLPRIVCVAGEDPISFAATKLHLPCHAIAYFPSSISKSVNEVI